MLFIELEKLTIEEVRHNYRIYLNNLTLSRNTIQTALSDSFYIWRKVSQQDFWRVVKSDNFEQESFIVLNEILPKQENGMPNKNISAYISHLRRFRMFAFGKEVAVMPLPVKTAQPMRGRRLTVAVPSPCQAEMEKYLNSWKDMRDYSAQETALDKLFFKLAPGNSTIEDILLKVSTLNDFYSTNIFSVFPVAEHILSLNIDERLKKGDPDLVDDIKGINGRNHYSFATKYCSHHNPLEYPIYDSYVDKILRHFRNLDGFCDFATDDLKEYSKFKKVILAFREYYGLTQYNLKEIDQYLWQLGKEYYPNNYGSKK